MASVLSSSSPAPAVTGLFDFQINGFGGVDFQDEKLNLADFEHAVSSLRKHQVAGIFTTFVTDYVDALIRKLENFERLCAASPESGSIVVGYHLEGPWMWPEAGYRGAHPAEPMHAPSIPEFEKFQKAANGRVRLVTLAPEWPGSSEVIRELTQRGISVALGHTNASEAQIDAAIEAGARFCTHLGNGTPVQMARHDNIIQRLLARDEMFACLIPDGIHLPPFVLKNFYRAKPPGRVLFTTDAMAGAGAGVGRYKIGELDIEVGVDGIARNPGGQGFAGSTLTPDEGVRRTAAYLNLSIATATELWSSAAATAFGVKLPALSLA